MAQRVALCLFMVFVVGVFDFLTGFELNFFAFYLIPVFLAVWCVSRGFGMVISILCVGASIAGDLNAGVRYSSSLVPIWNVAISMIFYLVVVWILATLRSLHQRLEERVRQRTAALNSEMQERLRLEEEILNVSEREQRRIGHDLHDSLCQHLTGVALAGEVLREQLAAQGRAEAPALGRIVGMIEKAIELTRTLARGLHPFELKGEGFPDALRELTNTITLGFKIPCYFAGDRQAVNLAPGVGVHLYRIAQEAINNALKHSKAREIRVGLETDADFVTLTVADDGVGVPRNPPGGKGMGLRIMAYRASVIGAQFDLERLHPQGTRIRCRVPLVAPAVA